MFIAIPLACSLSLVFTFAVYVHCHVCLRSLSRVFAFVDACVCVYCCICLRSQFVFAVARVASVVFVSYHVCFRLCSLSRVFSLVFVVTCIFACLLSRVCVTFSF